MKITKYGHACILIEIEKQGGCVKILIDPGAYSDPTCKTLEKIDAVVITHAHADHLDLCALHELMKLNPSMTVVSNKHVEDLLQKSSFQWQVKIVEDGQKTSIGGVSVEGSGVKHAEIFETIARCDNTGYLIDETLFYPGDSLETIPSKPVPVLALPIVAPWMLGVKEPIHYALKLNPKLIFPVHDGMLKITGAYYTVPEMIFKEHQLPFLTPKVLETFEFPPKQ